MQPEELFVFAGAGVSRSVPAGLPLFGQIRSELLAQLGLHGYVPPPRREDPRTERQQVADGLVPEPFLLALQRGGVDIREWLQGALTGGSPNGAHVALAQLAAAGARVWTVNFDTLIERAGPSGLRVCAWPDPPSDDTQLLKPHGTLTGQLIVTADQVLKGLERSWERQLRADVRGRTVVFVGYSGWDLDFQPLWNDVLHAAGRVLWFDLPDPAEQERKRRLLYGLASGGRLAFPQRPPPGPKGSPNPSWDFVEWCRERSLVDVDARLLERMHENVLAVALPRLEGSLPFARAATQQILGDSSAARRSYARLILGGPQRRHAALRLTELTLNHGGRLVGTVLAVGRLVPPAGRRGRALGGLMLNKRTTILSNRGRHAAVLRATGRPWADYESTRLVLRAAALRMTASLDEAAATAETAMQQALREGHPVRTANAAFQRGLALIWAGRLDEAGRHLEDHQRPYAALASTRWVAWADFTEAVLAIHLRRPEPAMRALDLGAIRFRADGLVDGQVDIDTVRLTALRLADDDHAYERHRRSLDTPAGPTTRRGIHYTRGSRFTREAIALEDAEFARVHRVDLDAADAAYRFVADSAHRIHAAMGHLGLASVEAQRGRTPTYAHTAAALGRQVNARLVVARAEALLTSIGTSPTVPDELFFP
jgi:hypothetical protein